MPYDVNGFDQPDWFKMQMVRGLLETEGWCQRHWKNKRGRRCVQQAIHEVWGTKRREDDHRVHRFVLDAAHQVTGMRYTEIPDFNDASGRTIDQIYEVLDLASVALGMPEVSAIRLPVPQIADDSRSAAISERVIALVCAAALVFTCILPLVT